MLVNSNNYLNFNSTIFMVTLTNNALVVRTIDLIEILKTANLKHYV